MADINLSRSAAEEAALDRRPRWQRWAEQQFVTGWTLVIDGHRDRALWTREGTSLDVAVARAWKIAELFGSRFGKQMRLPASGPKPAALATHTAPAPHLHFEIVPAAKAPCRRRTVGETYTSPTTGQHVQVSKYSLDQVAHVERLYLSCKPWAEIERLTQVPRVSGMWWMNALGLRRSVQMRSTSAPAGIEDDVVRLYIDPINPLGIEAVAEQLSLSTTRVLRILRARKLTRSRTEGVRLSNRHRYASRAASALRSLAEQLSDQDPLAARAGALVAELQGRFL